MLLAGSGLRSGSQGERDGDALLFNIACCESLAGRSADAIGHLRRVIELDSQLRTWVASDSDFDPIRDEPGFSGLLVGP